MPTGEKPKEKKYKYKVSCSWCKKEIEEKLSGDLQMEGKISHGICDECLKKHFPEDPEENKE